MNYNSMKLPANAFAAQTTIKAGTLCLNNGIIRRPIARPTEPIPLKDLTRTVLPTGQHPFFRALK